MIFVLSSTQILHRWLNQATKLVLYHLLSKRIHQHSATVTICIHRPGKEMGGFARSAHPSDPIQICGQYPSISLFYFTNPFVSLVFMKWRHTMTMLMVCHWEVRPSPSLGNTAKDLFFLQFEGNKCSPPKECISELSTLVIFNTCGLLHGCETTIKAFTIVINYNHWDLVWFDLSCTGSNGAFGLDSCNTSRSWRSGAESPA